MNVRLREDELEAVRASVESRRHELEAMRKKLVKAQLETEVVDHEIDVLERVETAIGDKPEDLFNSGPKKSDPGF